MKLKHVCGERVEIQLLSKTSPPFIFPSAAPSIRWGEASPGLTTPSHRPYLIAILLEGTVFSCGGRRFPQDLIQEKEREYQVRSVGKGVTQSVP